METTQPGGLHWEKVPSESRFGPSSPRYGHFSVSRLIAPGPKQAAEGAQRVCCGPLSAYHVRPIGHEASRTRTAVPWALSRAVFGPFGPVLIPLFGGVPLPRSGPRGAECGGNLEPKPGFRGGHYWGRPPPKFEAGGRGHSRLSFLTCCCGCCLLLTCSYCGERGVIIVNRVKSNYTRTRSDNVSGHGCLLQTKNNASCQHSCRGLWGGRYGVTAPQHQCATGPFWGG